MTDGHFGELTVAPWAGSRCGREVNAATVEEDGTDAGFTMQGEVGG